MIEEIRRLARQQKFRLTCHAAEEIAEEGIDEGKSHLRPMPKPGTTVSPYEHALGTLT
jgi:hypothetical protein